MSDSTDAPTDQQPVADSAVMWAVVDIGWQIRT